MQRSLKFTSKHSERCRCGLASKFICSFTVLVAIAAILVRIWDILLYNAIWITQPGWDSLCQPLRVNIAQYLIFAPKWPEKPPLWLCKEELRIDLVGKQQRHLSGHIYIEATDECTSSVYCSLVSQLVDVDRYEYTNILNLRGIVDAPNENDHHSPMNFEKHFSSSVADAIQTLSRYAN